MLRGTSRQAGMYYILSWRSSHLFLHATIALIHSLPFQSYQLGLVKVSSSDTLPLDNIYLNNEKEWIQYHWYAVTGT